MEKRQDAIGKEKQKQRRGYVKMPSGRRPDGYSEIDELNRILMVERELVLKTQENYRILKEKYLDLSAETIF
uniref:Uncharacterized protein n=2 Tax=Caenorhabditis japonica TaxID=281687 RepID=A0A8R1ERV4_CAEJA